MRKKVRNAAAVGLPQHEIARYVGISIPTLEKHYRAELDNAVIDMLVKAVDSLDKAIGAKSERSREFILETKGKAYGWTKRHEHTGKDGDPLLPSLEKLTDEQLAKLLTARQVVFEIAPETASGEGDRAPLKNGRAGAH